MDARELIRRIEATADPRLAASWDRSGVQIAGTVGDCERLAVALDPLPEFVEQALDWGATFLLTHHPLLLSPRLPDRTDDYHAVLRMVLGRGAWLYAAHTSLDVATDGPAGWLADALDLRRRRVLEPAGSRPHHLIRWRLATGKDRERLAETLAGLRRVRLLPALAADILEAVCPASSLGTVLTAGESSRFQAERLFLNRLDEPAEAYGYGLVGELPVPLSFPELASLLAGLLPRTFFVLSGEEPERIATLAYCPGSGADMAGRAFAAGADVYLTGDCKYHQAQGVPPGRLIIDVGHFALEEVMMRTFAAELAAGFGASGPTVRFFPGNDPFSAYFPDGTTPVRTE